MNRFSRLSITAWNVLGPALVFAQTKITINNPTDIKLKILCRIFGWGYTFLLVISAIVALYAAYLYVTSAGNPERIRQATKTIVFAAIGVAIAVLSNGFPNIINKIFINGIIYEACPS